MAEDEKPSLIIHDRDVKPIIVYAWERDGKFLNAWPGDGVEPPYDATRLELRPFRFPTGHLRKITFADGTRTHPHVNKDDSIMYSVGVQQVEFANRQVNHTHPGDCSLHPESVMHSSHTIVGGIRCEFSFAPQFKSGRDIIPLHARDMMDHEGTEIVEDGRRITIWGATDKRGAKFTAKIFAFPAYTLIEAHLPRGHVIPLHTNAAEKLLYVVKGRLKITTDTETDELETGDMARMVAGKPFAREALEESVVLEVDGSQEPIQAKR